MSFLVCGGAMLQCSFGLAPSVFMTLPSNKVNCMLPAANIMDNKPFVNILPFAMCRSVANPTVSAATAAAFGVITPMPCVPNTVTPWSPGCPTVTVGNQPALNDSSVLTCIWGGVIQIKNAGQMQIQTP